MINIEEIKKIVKLPNSSKLIIFFSAFKKRIYDIQCKLLSNEQPTVYINFLLNNIEGQSRIRFFIDSIETALKGNVEVFFNDQKQIGFVRALEGYRLNDVLGFTINMKEALCVAVQEYNLQTNNDGNRLDLNDVYMIHKLLDYSYFLLSLSFIKTRNEIIERNKNQLYKLQHYAAEVISIFEEEKICACASQGVFEIYNLYGTFVILNNSDNNRSFKNTKLIGLQIPNNILKKTCDKITSHTKAIAIDSNDRPTPFEKWIPNKPLKFICQPIRDSNYFLMGVLFVHRQGNVFDFSKFDGDLLNQFCYFTGVVLSNCRMATELAEKKEELSDLTGRLISSQEFERKRIAADIHDTLTQALTGMGYKALLCQEIMHKDPDRLNRELNELIALINKGLQESRQIASDLRPSILDDIGIVAAFRKLLNDFKSSTGIEAFFSSPDKITLNHDRGTALFRIFQEALSNIKKHSHATKVRVALGVNTKRGLYLQVYDNGQGFRPWKKRKMVRDSGMGLLIMRERTEKLGGKFDVSSRPTEGCKVSVMVPLNDRSRHAKH
ncbi:MAG: GAF domain-containing sensor histidine kinase [Deltaproteobacteria bacterium]|nr:GAF domain-containing sensor histidine kinase [Deltaproteobacteria bacterium]